MREENGRSRTILELMAEIESSSRESWLSARPFPWLLRFESLGDGASQQRALKDSLRRLSRDHLRTPLDTDVFRRKPPPTLSGRLWAIAIRAGNPSRNFVGLGAAEDCDLCFSGPGLRARHGILRWIDGELTFVSAVSSPSQVNGEPAEAQVPIGLRNHDWLRLGEAEDFLVLLPHGAYDFLKSCLHRRETV